MTPTKGKPASKPARTPHIHRLTIAGDFVPPKPLSGRELLVFLRGAKDEAEASGLTNVTVRFEALRKASR